MTCSFIVQELLKRPNLTTCYYFCNNQEEGNICLGILSIIVLQLLRQHPVLSTLIAHEYAYGGSPCGVSQLRRLVPQLLAIIGYTRVVVDGIDECPKADQKAILKEFQALCTGPSSHCKVLFSSRRDADIQARLSKQPQIPLQRRGEGDSDIRSFVKNELSKFHTSDQKVLDILEAILIEKADGE